MAIIHPLSEGIFTIGHDKVFVPFNPHKDVLTDRPIGSLLVEVQPFLIVAKSDLILFDTGLGFRNENGELQLHENIRKLGYEPARVTKVLLSHLHKDHAGGVTYKDETGMIKPTLPNAQYFIYKPEAEAALSAGTPSYMPAEIEPLLQSGQVQWLDGEEGMIDGYIKFSHSGGHCKEHIVYLLDDGEDKFFFGGDEAPQLKQLKMKYVAKYDFDGKKAMRLREQYAEKGRAEGWTFLFYHDVKMPVSKL